MLEVLKQLFENNVVSEDIKTEIEESWNKRIQENRDNVTAELLEEFARKFEHEKSIMVESLDRMLSERLSTEIAEFVEDRKQLVEAKAKYAKKMKKDANVMKEFVFRSLHGELYELHEDHKKMSENFSKLEEFVVTRLAKEISEFHIDKQDVVNTKVALVREAKAQLDAVKSTFIKRSAKMVEETVVKTLKTEMYQLREDISSARENDFGRRLFEAFASEYTHSYLNEKSEVKKVLSVLQQKEAQLAEAYDYINQTTQLVESKEHEIARMQDLSQRKEIVNELLAPLGRDKKEVMGSLLESVQTSKLRSAFDKYLPSVLNDGTSNTATRNNNSKALNESKAVTGNKPNQTTDDASSNIIEIRRLAGLR
jgi:hypothetical protein